MCACLTATIFTTNEAYLCQRFIWRKKRRESRSVNVFVLMYELYQCAQHRCLTSISCYRNRKSIQHIPLCQFKHQTMQTITLVGVCVNWRIHHHITSNCRTNTQTHTLTHTLLIIHNSHSYNRCRIPLVYAIVCL